MKTINGVLIFWSEIKIGAGGCELFVGDLGEGGGGSWGRRDRKWTPVSHYLSPYCRRWREAEGRFFNQ